MSQRQHSDSEYRLREGATINWEKLWKQDRLSKPTLTALKEYMKSLGLAQTGNKPIMARRLSMYFDDKHFDLFVMYEGERKKPQELRVPQLRKYMAPLGLDVRGDKEGLRFELIQYLKEQRRLESNDEQSTTARELQLPARTMTTELRNRRLNEDMVHSKSDNLLQVDKQEQEPEPVEFEYELTPDPYLNLNYTESVEDPFLEGDVKPSSIFNSFDLFEERDMDMSQPVYSFESVANINIKTENEGPSPFFSEIETAEPFHQQVHPPQPTTSRTESTPSSSELRLKLKEPILRLHRLPTFGCPFCENIYQSKALLAAHRHSRHAKQEKAIPKDRKCPRCEKVLRSREKFILHMRLHHQSNANYKKPFQCQQCSERFISRMRLKYHIIRTHATTTTYRPPVKKDSQLPTVGCNICYTMHLSPKSLNDHIRRKHKETCIPCGFCQKAFVSHSVLITHGYHHAAAVGLDWPSKIEFQLKCPYCKAQFPAEDRDALTEHIKVLHRGVQPNACGFCLQEFSSIQECRTHELTHTTQIPGAQIQSTQIQKDNGCRASSIPPGAPSKANANPNPNTIECKTCNRQFTSKVYLAHHMKAIHMGIQLFSCSFSSGKKFSERTALRQRELTRHLGPEQYPFRCNICGKQFLVQKSLEVHAKKQHAEDKLVIDRIFECKGCAKVYWRKSCWIGNLMCHNDTELWNTKEKGIVVERYEGLGRGKTRISFFCQNCNKTKRRRGVVRRGFTWAQRQEWKKAQAKEVETEWITAEPNTDDTSASASQFKDSTEGRLALADHNYGVRPGEKKVEYEYDTRNGKIRTAPLPLNSNVGGDNKGPPVVLTLDGPRNRNQCFEYESQTQNTQHQPPRLDLSSIRDQWHLTQNHHRPTPPAQGTGTGPETELKCTICGDTFSKNNKSALTQHIHAHAYNEAEAESEENDAYRCNVCKVICVGLESYEEHKRLYPKCSRSSVVRLLKCNICGCSFSGRSGLFGHTIVHQRHAFVECEIVYIS